jgi:multisubunit Na+/H+ antiporter MnhB subunit
MIEVVYAATEEPGGGFASFIPLLVFFVIYAFVFRWLAKRKGKSPWAYFFIGLVPIWNMIAFVVLLAHTDISVLERIRVLEHKLGIQSSIQPETESSRSENPDMRMWTNQ